MTLRPTYWYQTFTPSNFDSSMSSYQSLSREDSSDYDLLETGLGEIRGKKRKTEVPDHSEQEANYAYTLHPESSPQTGSGFTMNQEIKSTHDDENTERTEIRMRGIILVLILSTILSSANCYLGLYSGISISVSIPSAIIAFSVLKPFKTSIYEVNSVQTGASAGSTLVAGIIFTLPALLIINFWTKINIIQSIVVGLLGGTLGVFLSIPLRSALLTHANLLFPEGVATAQILFLSFPNHPRTLFNDESSNLFPSSNNDNNNCNSVDNNDNNYVNNKNNSNNNNANNTNKKKKCSFVMKPTDNNATLKLIAI